MNELNKLIQQFEKENPGRVAYEGDIESNCDFYKNFVLWLATRPTCGVEQRKFLDEVEKAFTMFNHWMVKKDRSKTDPYSSELNSIDFPNVDFEKVIKGE